MLNRRLPQTERLYALVIRAGLILVADEKPFKILTAVHINKLFMLTARRQAHLSDWTIRQFCMLTQIRARTIYQSSSKQNCFILITFTFGKFRSCFEFLQKVFLGLMYPFSCVLWAIFWSFSLLIIAR